MSFSTNTDFLDRHGTLGAQTANTICDALQEYNKSAKTALEAVWGDKRVVVLNSSELPYETLQEILEQRVFNWWLPRAEGERNKENNLLIQLHSHSPTSYHSIDDTHQRHSFKGTNNLDLHLRIQKEICEALANDPDVVDSRRRVCGVQQLIVADDSNVPLCTDGKPMEDDRWYSLEKAVSSLFK